MTSDPPPQSGKPLSLDTLLFDRDAKRVTATLQDGTIIDVPVDPAHPIWTTNIAKSLFHWDSWLLFLTSDTGGLVTCEVFSPVGTERQRGRPVVYLDQNHWSTLVNSVVEPDRVQK